MEKGMNNCLKIIITSKKPLVSDNVNLLTI